MTDLRQAADKIAADANAHGWKIDQIDPVLAETGDSIMFYAYATTGDCVFAAVDLPMRLATECALLTNEWRDALMRLLPSDLLNAEAMT